ncbi:Hypothetical protein DPCES_3684 [Desulfitobacterium hafniense]|uniref:Uncharacterized protein n=1 Tax=Desulfitobacterium hafniense TaxID=49338 RepID=A0A098B5B0_DESHA|nr:Hypothetical protein DPCES_3684 [Desulfitobacterium hafniense]
MNIYILLTVKTKKNSRPSPRSNVANKNSVQVVYKML